MSDPRTSSTTPRPPATRRILVVDDDQVLREGLTRLLTAEGYSCDSAGDARAARERISSDLFDLILCDIQMPGESGLDLLEQVARERADTAIVMVTGVDDPQVARRAIEMGAYGYVVKPFHTHEITIGVLNALTRLDLERGRRIHSEELEDKLTDRTVALEKAIAQLERFESSDEQPWHETVDRLGRALALRDEETGRHIERVGLYCELLAEKSGVGEQRSQDIRQASILHDVGKIGIPDAILTKPGKLTASEMDIVRRHSQLGFQLLKGSGSALLDLAASIALTHHERWDGKGYPRGLSGEEIPLEGRITAIADVFDAITSTRVYRGALGLPEALSIIEAERGRHFDPQLVDAFLGAVDEFLAIRELHPDLGGDGDQIRVLIVDEQEMFVNGIVSLLDRTEGITVAANASSVREALELTQTHEPDVITADWNLPDGTVADLIASVNVADPTVKVLVLTASADDVLMAQAIDAGCSSVLTKSRAFEELVSAIRAAHAGEVTISLSKLSSVITRLRVPDRKKASDLTPREFDILALLGEGLSNEAIAEQLSLSVHTVRNHVQRIITKMGAHSKLEAVAEALREGSIQAPPRFASV